jgi:hypothetical protein
MPFMRIKDIENRIKKVGLIPGISIEWVTSSARTSVIARMREGSAIQMMIAATRSVKMTLTSTVHPNAFPTRIQMVVPQGTASIAAR